MNDPKRETNTLPNEFLRLSLQNDPKRAPTDETGFPEKYDYPQHESPIPIGMPLGIHHSNFPVSSCKNASVWSGLLFLRQSLSFLFQVSKRRNPSKPKNNSAPITKKNMAPPVSPEKPGPHPKTEPDPDPVSQNRIRFPKTVLAPGPGRGSDRPGDDPRRGRRTSREAGQRRGGRGEASGRSLGGGVGGGGGVCVCVCLCVCLCVCVFCFSPFIFFLGGGQTGKMEILPHLKAFRGRVVWPNTMDLV